MSFALALRWFSLRPQTKHLPHLPRLQWLLEPHLGGTPLHALRVVQTALLRGPFEPHVFLGIQYLCRNFEVVEKSGGDRVDHLLVLVFVALGEALVAQSQGVELVVGLLVPQVRNGLLVNVRVH